MGSDCSYQIRSHEHSKSQKIDFAQQSHPMRPSMQIVLAPRRPIVNKKIQLSLESSAVLESGSNESKTAEKQEPVRAQLKKTKQYVEFANNQKILQDLQMKPTLSGEQNHYNIQIVSPEPEGSVLSRPNIKLNIECPSEARESLMSAWNKSNFNDEMFFKTVCYDTLFISQLKLTPKQQ